MNRVVIISGMMFLGIANVGWGQASGTISEANATVNFVATTTYTGGDRPAFQAGGWAAVTAPNPDTSVIMTVTFYDPSGQMVAEGSTLLTVETGDSAFVLQTTAFRVPTFDYPSNYEAIALFEYLHPTTLALVSMDTETEVFTTD